MDYKKAEKIHFIGIGGIGISAIARMMLLEGKEVSGSDREASAITDELKRLGAHIFVGHDETNIPHDTESVIYTIAIPEDNPELLRAQKLGIPMMTYPEMLGAISKNKFTIAVSGTHGKTTTTGMIGKILIDAGLHPTVILGSLLKDVNSNFVVGEPKEGEKDILVVEACEYRRSFLNLSPDILVITNIDADHLDYYKDIDDIKSAFRELVERVEEGGHIVANTNEANTASVIANTKKHIIDYSSYAGEKLMLTLPGDYNVKNAQAAISVSEILGISDDTARKALADFKGTWRRFEYKGETRDGARIYDDYAHHPSEIQAFLKAVRECFPKKTITAIFQPHLYSRTQMFLDELAESFNDVDKIILAPVYAAREEPEAGVDAPVLAEKMKEAGKNVLYVSNFKDIEKEILTHTGKEDIVLTIGAGDIFKVGETLIK